MGKWVEQEWLSDLSAGMRRADRRGGPFLAYIPDDLVSRPLVVSSEVAAKSAAAERAIHDLAAAATVSGLEGISRFLLRSEAIASSLIEGIAPSPQQVALAELAQDESIHGFSEQAALVANNITVLRRASQDLVDAEAVGVTDIVALQHALLLDERHHGLRTVQNWIGGSNWHPLDAVYVPPPPEEVSVLMADLADYLNGSVHAPLIQAGLVHAQFETIHPFTDGNGRVGRALIHTVLARRRLTPAAILPISLVLSTFRGSYVDALTAYRHDGGSGGAEANAAAGRWLSTFLDATIAAAEQAASLAEDIEELRREWLERLAAQRDSRGRRTAPRADSATTRILALLPELPVMTTNTAGRVLAVSSPAARAALEELADAGVLTRKSVDRGSTGYIAREVLDLVTYAERRLGGTRFDTRTSAPNRPVPALPERTTSD